MLQSLLSRGLTEEEVAIVLVQDIFAPKIEADRDQKDKLAFAFKSSKYYQ